MTRRSMFGALSSDDIEVLQDALDTAEYHLSDLRYECADDYETEDLEHMGERELAFIRLNKKLQTLKEAV